MEKIINKNIIETGEEVCLYLIKNNMLNIRDGLIKEIITEVVYVDCDGKQLEYDRETSSNKYVYFKDGGRTPFPGYQSFGQVNTNGTVLWLKQRNDILAKRLFLDYQNMLLAKMFEKINIKKELIKMLSD